MSLSLTGHCGTNSPDLNPVDYVIWGLRVFHGRKFDTADQWSTATVVLRGLPAAARELFTPP